MQKQLLLNSQKNLILEIIESYDLDPLSFKWKEVKSNGTNNLIVSRLEMDTGSYFFQFDFNGEHHLAIYSPGTEKMIDDELVMQWDLKLSHFEQWVKNLRRELNQPDLWAEFSKYSLPDGTEIDPETSNERFAYQDVEKILTGIEQIKKYVKEEIETNEAQDKLVNEKLEYLSDAVKRQGRKDWMHTCIGVIMTLAVALALSPTHADAIWGFIKASVSGLVQFLPSGIQE